MLGSQPFESLVKKAYNEGIVALWMQSVQRWLVAMLKDVRQDRGIKLLASIMDVDPSNLSHVANGRYITITKILYMMAELNGAFADIQTPPPRQRTIAGYLRAVPVLRRKNRKPDSFDLEMLLYLHFFSQHYKEWKEAAGDPLERRRLAAVIANQVAGELGCDRQALKIQGVAAIETLVTDWNPEWLQCKYIVRTTRAVRSVELSDI
jgi:hypothetical protein